MAFDYTSLITSEHADKPKFSAVVSLLAGSMGQISDALAAMPGEFNLDVAVGAQLDIIGLWVGLSRYIVTPITGAFFSWNTPGLGWNESSWRGPFDPSEGIVALDDATYRAALKAKIAVNYWDGSVASQLEISTNDLASLGIVALAVDNFDMSMDVLYIVDTGLYAALTALLKRGLFPPKPATVHINGYFVSSVPGEPFFGFGPETIYIAGFGDGAWAEIL